ncbi:MAG: tRNA (adenosine(37)-N6)-dimethylallyltransferase MiaA [Erysipelothrix sp.]|nr:tRNA (adenosine(37)-N6)-dimethylallyltransferase MiaA [Erysipelothrix sp.]
MIYVISGLTASGKSNAAIKLAQEIDAEIISADSVAVYKQLNIGSAKPTEYEQSLVRHHLINILDYKDSYSVADFQEQARDKIVEITNRGKQVIVVGGTGLYIKALLYDYRFEKENNQNYERFESNEVLYKELMSKDPIEAKKIHPNNRKRVIRALASYDYHGLTRSELTKNRQDKQIINAKVYFLYADREYIYERINQRVLEMFESGLEEEVIELYKQDRELFNYNSLQSIGYREFERYFNEEIDKSELISDIQRNTRRFAKRQMTWFKHQQPSTWIDIENENPVEVILKDSVQFE